MYKLIYSVVKEALKASNFPGVEFTVEYPTQISHGDVSTNVAMVVAKELKKPPREVAQTLADIIRERLGEQAAKVEVAGPGFINISFSTSFYSLLLEEALAEPNELGKGKTLTNKRIIVEFGNPNPFKEMHIGHLMGAIIGESIARLIENEGATVARDTFGGDVGPPVAKTLWGLQHMHNTTSQPTAEEIGKAYKHGSRAYEDSSDAHDAIDKLNVTVYHIMNKIAEHKPLTDDEQEIYEKWRIGREVSMEAFEQLYKKLGTRFDYTFYDSDTTVLGLDAVNRGLTNGIFEKSDGAVVYHGEKKGLHTLVFITSRGTPTYETKDIGLAFLKEERFPSDQSIIITANEQIGHFQVMLAALNEIAPIIAKKTVHISHGFLRLTTGKMSSRTGDIISANVFLEDVLAHTLRKNSDRTIAMQVAIGAVKYMILRRSPGADIIFDPEKSLSLEGDSGPYIQYALVRALSVLRTAEEKGKNINAPVLTQDIPSEPYVLMRMLARFPDITTQAQKHLAPNILVTYLTQLASQWNSFYANNQIIGGKYEGYSLRLANLFSHTMNHGLTLLGIPTLERM